jgi:metal-dependent HD superfamily phosphatase/phosphodiesterase
MVKIATLDAQLEAEMSGSPARAAWQRISQNRRFLSACEMANAVAVNRLGYNDHGYTHVRIAALNALKIAKLLLKRGVTPTFAAEGHGSVDDAEAIILLGTLLHDVGNAVQRNAHEQHGVAVAMPILEEVLPAVFGENVEKARLAVLSCIYEHGDDVLATSIESSIAKVADGTDCENGRARIPYRMYGKSDIHAVSALAIRRVEIRAGKRVPVEILVDMSNPAGVFQIQEVLEKKISSSAIAAHVAVTPLLNGKPLGSIDLGGISCR